MSWHIWKYWYKNNKRVYFFNILSFNFLGVSLRCARVGLLRTTRSLRCYATLRTA
ncbi:MAG: hypothetical protein NZ455_03320 [Bacteroidia bacterium]|nr:hypothetical protein [Bacteroidia bacterium]MDW8346354.1 hypothetical protein [Bacteroidia bacterium]